MSKAKTKKVAKKATKTPVKAEIKRAEVEVKSIDVEVKSVELDEVKPDKPVEVPPKAPAVWVVCDGLFITSRRGLLKGGTVVSPRDFPGGEATLTELIQKKHVVKQK